MRKECIERERYPRRGNFRTENVFRAADDRNSGAFVSDPKISEEARKAFCTSPGASAEGVKISVPETDTGHCPPCVKVNEKEPIFSQICLIFPYFYDILMCKVKNCALQRISIQKK